MDIVADAKPAMKATYPTVLKLMPMKKSVILMMVELTPAGREGGNNGC